jgi:hypothetical protein
MQHAIFEQGLSQVFSIRIDQTGYLHTISGTIFSVTAMKLSFIPKHLTFKAACILVTYFKVALLLILTPKQGHFS